MDKKLHVIFFGNTDDGMSIVERLQQQSKNVPFMIELPDHSINLNFLSIQEITEIEHQLASQIKDNLLKELYVHSSKVYLEHDPNTIKIGINIDPL